MRQISDQLQGSSTSSREALEQISSQLEAIRAHLAQIAPRISQPSYQPSGYPTSTVFEPVHLFSSKASGSSARVGPSATDNISSGQSLSENQTIVSKGGNFVLGFFTPRNSRNYYVGIWYNKISVQTVIWVANRATPITNTSSAEFKISEDSKLVLLSSSKILVWSSNSTPSTSDSTVAVLHDTGNLVIRNGSNTTIWQSFDHPTDIVMPAGWIGFNKITGEFQSATAWETPENPAPGPFTLSLDPDRSKQYVLLWNNSEIYWSSGIWNGRYFPALPASNENTPFNLTFIDNEQRIYGTYTILYSSFITHTMIGPTGLLTQWYWLDSTQEWQSISSQPVPQCDVYSLCGTFGICDQKSSDNICKCTPGFEPASMNEWELNCNHAAKSFLSFTFFLVKKGYACDWLALCPQVGSGCADNILLDRDFCAKVADFGMAKLVGRDFSRVLTTMRGTVGYLGPEWLSGLPITSKASETQRTPWMVATSFILRGLQERLLKGGIFSLLDHRLNGVADTEELTRVCRVARWCIQDSESHRPTMGQVVQILEGVLEVSMQPLPRALQLLTEDQSQIRYHLSSTEYEDALDQSLDFYQ
ncbi:G-type lectin S-receptor-like serine/threonine-protein kinase At2g19130 [Elaeis guineensis]|uniref:G-type lectin S-receptor-like serine/threonine-protein kinase At2g19130 n=1 Tax=Elaeis guineensis var. tenera TaxID=51953 RepID=UPI003C6CE358